jgi:hypothetical protein
MIYRSIFVASLILAVTIPCGAQTPNPGAPAASSSDASATAGASPPAASSSAAPASSAASPAASSSTASPSSSASNASDEPSPQLLKEARREGFRPKKRNGETQFCYTDKSTGTHFETEKCYNQQQMEQVVQQRQDERDQLHQQSACTGCKGH